MPTDNRTAVGKLPTEDIGSTDLLCVGVSRFAFLGCYLYYTIKRAERENLYQLDLEIAIERVLSEKAEIKSKQLEIKFKHEQLIDNGEQKIGPQAEQLQNEELAKQHHSNLLLVKNCVGLLKKQKDFQCRFEQLSRSYFTNTNTDIITHNHLNTEMLVANYGLTIYRYYI
ncbi:hypothetical protein TSAR_013771 [Trichomalopsis sarcophagae]|uniref:Uncharacterized protein n=1 Tax=Trichomalopsis sarcophagae TaxID=543379 RepID=A0A232FN54_9HYME|nr:hypothetical protein TSAR_013771 [Trichomalopsis sarcophagae]